MFNWLTEHLPWAAEIAAPLQQLYHSGRWEWTANHENAFRRMKQIVGGSEVLKPLDLGPNGLPIYVVTDASLVGSGGYIAQGKTLETAKPAVYHSRVFNPAQTNYPVHEQELLALEDTIKSYEHWLIGRPFTAVTDSQAMLSLMKQKHLSPRQWRSVTYLSKFDITFKFIEGKKNIIADLLSRIAERSTYKHDLPYLQETDTHLAAIQLRRGKTLLDKPAIKKRMLKVVPETLQDISERVDPEESSDIPKLTTFSLSSYQQAILDGYKTDVQFSKALVAGVDSGVYVKDAKGLLYTGPDRDQLCIPNVKVRGGRDGTKKSLREMLIAHSHQTLGHVGTYKITLDVREQYYWKTMTGDIDKYIRSCHSCQTNKTAPTKQYGKNHPLPTPSRPWEYISMDFLVNLPSSAIGDQKYNSLFVVVDTFIKMCHLIPTTTNVKAEGVAKLYFEHIYRLHGLPKGIISDRDTKFTGAFWRALQKMVGTDLMMSTTDHPQTDGQSERMNRSVYRYYVTSSIRMDRIGHSTCQQLSSLSIQPFHDLLERLRLNYSTDIYLGHSLLLYLTQIIPHR